MTDTMNVHALTLASLEQGLQEPFAPEVIQYLPRAARKKENGEWVCLALPYADKRVYEDRLNDLAFGAWSTPYNAPYAIENKLVIPVTVAICDVEHTDYGEAFLRNTSRSGECQEAENSVTIAYSQGFRRACAQFRLGRYIYRLLKVWTPYDPTTKTIALTETQRTQLTLRLYRTAGLLPSVPSLTPAVVAVPLSPHVTKASQEPDSVQSSLSFSGSALLPTEASSQTKPQSVAPAVPRGVSSTTVPSTTRALIPSTASSSMVSSSEPVAAGEFVVPHFTTQVHKRRWLEQRLQECHQDLECICSQYKVAHLGQLSDAQTVHLANRIFAAQKHAHQKRRQSPVPTRSVNSVASVSPVSSASSTVSAIPAGASRL